MSFIRMAGCWRPTLIAMALLATVPAMSAGGGAAAGSNVGVESVRGRQGKDIVLEGDRGLPSGGLRPVQLNASETPPAPSQTHRAVGDMPRQHAFAVAATDLGLAMLRDQVARQGNAAGNGVYSPFGIVGTLGMLHAASEGDTRREVGRLLVPAAAGEMEMALRLRELLPRMSGGNGVKFQVANALWVNQSTGLHPSSMFQSALNQDYKATMRVLDFSSGAAAVAQINAEVSRQTGGNIARLLADGALGERTRFVLTNALYFKGQWANRFDPAQTRPGAFQLDDGTVAQVPMMLGRISFREAVVDNVQIFELPYAGERYSLLIALPPAGHSLAALEQDLRGADVQAWWTNLRPAEGDLMLPRVRIAAQESMRMRGLLENMGMRKAFSGAAEFSGLGAGPDTHLDEVFHSATFAMDEEGAEAAAATAAVGVSKGIGALPRRIDRPFLFMIVHKPSRMPVAMGRVARPD